MTEQTVASQRWLLPAGAGGLVLAFGGTSGGSPATAIPIAVLLLAGVTGVLAARRARVPVPSPVMAGVVIAFVALPGGLFLAADLAPDSEPVRAAVAVAFSLISGAVVAADRLSPRGRRLLTVAWVALSSTLSALALKNVPQDVDVFAFQTEAARAVLSGANPYTTTLPNIYSDASSMAYYGPGVVSGDHLTYGYPYLPVSAVGAIPGYVLGDVRLSSVLALALLAALAVWLRPDLPGRLVAVALITSPAMILVVGGAWTEPILLVLFGGAVIAITQRRFLAGAVLLGLALACKQYLVVVLPCLWLLRRRFTRRHWAVMFGVTVAVLAPFIAVSPVAFRRAVIDWQFLQPFRSDSLSLLVALVNQLGWPPPAVYSILPLAAGAASAVLLAWRLRPGPAAFALATGLVLLTTVLSSKQAFVNYYSFIGGCLLMAAWASTTRDPVFRGLPSAGDSSSIGGHVAEVGDVWRKARIHA